MIFTSAIDIRIILCYNTNRNNKLKQKIHMEIHKQTYTNTAAWEAQMMYAQRDRDQARKTEQQNYNSTHKEAYRAPHKQKLKKAMAKLAISTSLLGVGVASHNYTENNSTVNDTVSQINFNDSSKYNLDITPDNLDEYTLVPETDDANYIIELDSGNAIRTNDEDYTWTYDAETNPTHNALAQNVEEKTQIFEIKEGPIYKTPNGRIAVKSENLTENINGEKTGIKFELDSDEWSVVDASPNELKVIQDFKADE